VCSAGTFEARVISAKWGSSVRPRITVGAPASGLIQRSGIERNARAPSRCANART
jgi:hypothetical protein